MTKKSRTDQILDCIDTGLQRAGDIDYGGPGAGLDLCVRCDSRSANDTGWCDYCQPNDPKPAPISTPGDCQCSICVSSWEQLQRTRGGPYVHSEVDVGRLLEWAAARSLLVERITAQVTRDLRWDDDGEDD